MIRPDSNFVNIGERTNVTGSPKFAQLIRAGEYDEALAVARQQVEGGAQILDVNMDEGLLDSAQAMRTFLNLLAAEPDIARVPVMIDSLGLARARGRAEVPAGQGRRQLDLAQGGRGRVRATSARLVRRYGAAVVVMAFDEQGQAATVERRVAILRARLPHPDARRSASRPRTSSSTRTS